MSRCIQPQCKCTGYKEPPKAKNSLLQFRLSCQECGHQASEHRKLTPVDHYIKSEVAAGKRARCTYCILPSDIPTSPVFSNYEIILIPTDEACEAGVKENTVPCTCRGFKVSDLIKLCQAYRTHCMADVTSKLKDSLCSFCNHPLLFHSANSNQDVARDSKLLPPHLSKRPILGPHQGMSLRASSVLAFSPANSSCLELLMPSSVASEFFVVAVGTFRCSEKLKLAVLGCGVTTTSSAAAVDKCVSSNADDSMEVDPPDGSTVVPTSTPHMCGSNLSNRGVKKSRNKTSEAGGKRSRRSMRLATKTVKKEAESARRKLKGLKGAKRLHKVDYYEEEEEEEEERDDEDFAGDRELVGEGSASFVNHLGKEENYCSYHLPQEILDVKPTSVMATALRSTCTSPTVCPDVSQDACGSQDTATVVLGRSSSVLVAVGSKQRSDIFLAVVSVCEQKDKTLLRWHKVECVDQGRLECLALNDDGSAGSCSEDVIISLVAGMRSGLVCVWTVFPERGGLTGSPALVTEINCSSQVLAISCSPGLSSDRLLAAGTVLGEVMFCFLSNSKNSEDVGVVPNPTSFPMVQRVHCSCAPISCITWSADGRLVAVGGSDDAVQVLQCADPPKTRSSTAKNCPSLLNYFKKTASCRWPKLLHTHTLKGHNSFVAGLAFSRGHFLTSLGWDGQLLFWKHLTNQRRSYDHRVIKCRGGRYAVELVEPVGGYKLGPSTAVEFLPTRLYTLMAGCDFMVAMDNKYGGVTVASYAKSTL